MDINKLLAGVEQGEQKMLSVYERALPGVESQTQAVVNAAGAVAGAGGGVRDAVNAHKDAVMQAGQASDKLADAQGKLDQIKLTETFEADNKFRGQLTEAIKAQDNLAGIKRLEQMQAEYQRNSQKIIQAVQKENTNPIQSIFDGTYSERKALENANIQLKDAMTVEAGAVQLGAARIDQLLSNESNLRRLTTEQQFKAATELNTAKVIQAKAINKQKVTESDLNDMQTIYGLSKDQVSAMATALNATTSMASAGIDMYRSVINTQMLKANLETMRRQFQKEDEFDAELSAVSDQLASIGVKISPTRLRNPEGLTTEEAGAVRTALSTRAFGDNNLQTYNSLSARAAYDSAAQSKLLAGTQLWYQRKAAQLDEQIANTKDGAAKANLITLRSKLQPLPQNDFDKAEIAATVIDAEKKMETVDASEEFAYNMYALSDPRATDASGERTTFQALKANGALALDNPQLFDSIPVNFTVAGNNPGRTVSANFDAVADGLVAKSKSDTTFKLSSESIQSVAEDMVRIFKFQNATASANPNLPFNPKTVSFREVDVGGGSKGFFGGYAPDKQTVDMSNPQTAYVMLENRIKRAILASQEAAKMAANGSDATLMRRTTMQQDNGGW